MNLSDSITVLKGIGEKTAENFHKVNIYEVKDLINNFPRTYIQYPKLMSLPIEETINEQAVAILGRVKQAPVQKKSRRGIITACIIGNADSYVELVWYNMPYIKNQILAGKNQVFYGRLVRKNGRAFLEQPKIFTEEEYLNLQLKFMPVYNLTKNLTNNAVIKATKAALKEAGLEGDFIPAYLREKYFLSEYNFAMEEIHFPKTMDNLILARKRLVFEEFFLFLMGLSYQKEKTVKEKSSFVLEDESIIEELKAKLPFPLTNAQSRTLDELISDMKSGYVMQRLIQGDVGSGKTIVAFLVMAWCSKNKCQSAIMAPTEVLARQHYENFCQMVEEYGLDCPVFLLTGSLTAAQKKKTYEQILNSPNALIVGTHALIQEKVIYNNLALIITDEQHRFGVRQRETFMQKGKSPHTIVMSATPIPRTLAIIIYGDMDISVIDEVPARRLPIKNCVVGTSYRPTAYKFIEDQIKSGHQAYIICPLVEESEAMEGENVTDYSKMLEAYYEGRVRVGMLHGKMKNEKKNEIMQSFAKNEIQVLVSTTVVEVGVNVPNATVMMIENSDRFGLAGLHQLRGRVGRGDAQSYCIFLNTSNSKTSAKRLETLNKSNDGFYIASEDLKLRGPGDFFGIRQSGDLAFKLADIYQDSSVLKDAKESVDYILDTDPELKQPEHRVLAEKMKTYLEYMNEKMNL